MNLYRNAENTSTRITCQLTPSKPDLGSQRRFIVRDFVYSEDEVAKQQQELEDADTTEKELWTELLRLSRTNFSEAFQILVHLKIVRLFVESVLRYGLPANYLGIIIKVSNT